ncbi:putative methyltransferase-domain-containing protein [Chytridium lagenaria]|nr:putative methyltransferase-domain-containing protein [Chytridium lagenaria]
MLLLCGPEQAWRFDFIKPIDYTFSNPSSPSFFTIANRPIFTSSSTTKHTDHVHHTVKTALTVWDCSIVLSKFLQCHSSVSSSLNITGKRLIELGSGRGIVGIAASILGAHTTLSDVEAVVPDIHEIVKLNDVEAEVVALDWTDSKETVKELRREKGFEFVVAADVVWVSELIRPLVETIRALMSKETTLVLAHQTRSTRGDEILFAEMRKAGLEWIEADLGVMDPTFLRKDVTVFVATLKETGVEGDVHEMRKAGLEWIEADLGVMDPTFLRKDVTVFVATLKETGVEGDVDGIIN